MKPFSAPISLLLYTPIHHRLSFLILVSTSNPNSDLPLPLPLPLPLDLLTDWERQIEQHILSFSNAAPVPPRGGPTLTTKLGSSNNPSLHPNLTPAHPPGFAGYSEGGQGAHDQEYRVSLGDLQGLRAFLAALRVRGLLNKFFFVSAGNTPLTIYPNPTLTLP